MLVWYGALHRHSHFSQKIVAVQLSEDENRKVNVETRATIAKTETALVG